MLDELTASPNFPEQRLSLTTTAGHLEPLLDDTEVIESAAVREKAESMFGEPRRELRLSRRPSQRRITDHPIPITTRQLRVPGLLETIPGLLETIATTIQSIVEPVAEQADAA